MTWLMPRWKLHKITITVFHAAVLTSPTINLPFSRSSSVNPSSHASHDGKLELTFMLFLEFAHHGIKVYSYTPSTSSAKTKTLPTMRTMYSATNSIYSQGIWCIPRDRWILSAQTGWCTFRRVARRKGGRTRSSERGIPIKRVDGPTTQLKFGNGCVGEDFGFQFGEERKLLHSVT